MLVSHYAVGYYVTCRAPGAVGVATLVASLFNLYSLLSARELTATARCLARRNPGMLLVTGLMNMDTAEHVYCCLSH